jgi:NagD protein
MPAVVCDIDGVVLGDNRALHGAPEFTRRLVGDGIPFLFLTNFPSQTPADLRNRFICRTGSS